MRIAHSWNSGQHLQIFCHPNLHIRYRLHIHHRHLNRHLFNIARTILFVFERIHGLQSRAITIDIHKLEPIAFAQYLHQKFQPLICHSILFLCIIYRLPQQQNKHQIHSWTSFHIHFLFRQLFCMGLGFSWVMRASPHLKGDLWQWPKSTRSARGPSRVLRSYVRVDTVRDVIDRLTSSSLHAFHRIHFGFIALSQVRCCSTAKRHNLCDMHHSDFDAYRFFIRWVPLASLSSEMMAVFLTIHRFASLYSSTFPGMNTWSTSVGNRSYSMQTTTTTARSLLYS